jgi:hypothetical protein
VDLAILIPGVERESPTAAAAIASARDTLTRLGAAPFLRRLDEATSRSGDATEKAGDRADRLARSMPAVS